MQLPYLVSGICLICWGITSVTVGLLYLDGCPRHPLLPLWLLAMGVVILLGAVITLVLPTCSTPSTSKMSNHKVSIGTVVLVFLTMLLSILLVLTIVSWLSVGTFWLLSRPLGLQVVDECSTSLLVVVGLTVLVCWFGLLAGSFFGIWRASKICDCSRVSYFPVRRRENGAEYQRVVQGFQGNIQ